MPEAEVPVDLTPYAGCEAIWRMTQRPSPKSSEDSDSSNNTGPSPPLTRGRKSNKERREAEALANISAGAQTTLAPFLKGQSSKR